MGRHKLEVDRSFAWAWMLAGAGLLVAMVAFGGLLWWLM